jgi:hypothetical protein
LIYIGTHAQCLAHWQWARKPAAPTWKSMEEESRAQKQAGLNFRWRKRDIISLAGGLFTTAAVFSWLFSHVSWTQVLNLIRRVDTGWIGIFLVLSLGQQLLRTYRYRLVLKTAGGSPGFFRMLIVVLVRGFCVDLLPARTGELVYLYLLKARLGVGLGAATASFALPFLFDILALGPLVILAVLVSTGSGLSVPALVGAGLLLAALSTLAVGLMPLFLRIGFAVTAKGRLAMQRFRRFLADTHRQVIRARRARIYGQLFLLSVLVRVMKYSGMYAILVALLKPEGYTIAQLHIPSAFLGFCSAEMAASLPFSGVAGFGAYEGTWSLVLQMLGFPKEMASASGISHHLLTQVYGYTLGLVALIAMQLIGKRRPDSSGPAASVPPDDEPRLS